MFALFIGKDCWVFISKFLIYYRDWNNLRCTSKQLKTWLDFKLALILWGDEIYHPSFAKPTNFLEWVPTLRFYKCLLKGTMKMSNPPLVERFSWAYNKDVIAKWDRLNVDRLKLWDNIKVILHEYRTSIDGWIITDHHVFLASEFFGFRVEVFDKNGFHSKVQLYPKSEEKDTDSSLMFHYRENFVCKTYSKKHEVSENHPSLIPKIQHCDIFKFESLSQDKFSIEKFELIAEKGEKIHPFFIHKNVIGICNCEDEISFITSDRKMLWSKKSDSCLFQVEAFAVRDHIILIQQYERTMLIEKFNFSSDLTMKLQIKDKMLISTQPVEMGDGIHLKRRFISQRFGYQIFGIEQTSLQTKAELFRFDLLRFEKHEYHFPKFCPTKVFKFLTTQDGFTVSNTHFYFQLNKRIS